MNKMKFRNSKFYSEKALLKSESFTLLKELFKINALFWTIYQIILKMYHGFNKKAAQMISTLIYVPWASSQHIRINSEGSRDTEDYSNGWGKFSIAIRMN